MVRRPPVQALRVEVKNAVGYESPRNVPYVSFWRKMNYIF